MNSAHSISLSSTLKLGECTGVFLVITHFEVSDAEKDLYFLILPGSYGSI